MDLSILIAVVVVGVAVVVVAFLFTRRKSKKEVKEVVAVEIPVVVPPPKTVTGKSDLKNSLKKTRGFFGNLIRQWGTGPAGAKDWEKFEEILLEADVGVSTTQILLQKLKTKADNGEGALPLAQNLGEVCLELLSNSKNPFQLPEDKKPYVIQIVGVNGVGKTTTIGKLARYFKDQGKSVLLGAADTFRAAAIQQLKVWADRANTEFVTGRDGADPGAVTFDSLSAGKARGMDVVILDTAGRLHTKISLMDELKKIDRVMKKVIPDAPHETWLVLDGTLGQNSVRQAQEFYKALQITGVIITKLDGTAKGGALLSITHELNLPVRFIGIGEKAEDFIPFEPRAYIDALISE